MHIPGAVWRHTDTPCKQNTVDSLSLSISSTMGQHPECGVGQDHGEPLRARPHMEAESEGIEGEQSWQGASGAGDGQVSSVTNVQRLLEEAVADGNLNNHAYRKVTALANACSGRGEGGGQSSNAASWRLYVAVGLFNVSCRSLDDKNIYKLLLVCSSLFSRLSTSLIGNHRVYCQKFMCFKSVSPHFAIIFKTNWVCVCVCLTT